MKIPKITYNIVTNDDLIVESYSSYGEAYDRLVSTTAGSTRWTIKKASVQMYDVCEDLSYHSKHLVSFTDSLYPMLNRYYWNRTSFDSHFLKLYNDNNMLNYTICMTVESTDKNVKMSRLTSKVISDAKATGMTASKTNKTRDIFVMYRSCMEKGLLFFKDEGVAFNLKMACQGLKFGEVVHITPEVRQAIKFVKDNT